MKRFTLSAVSILLATAALTPDALAISQVESDFNLHSQRLEELDARNKADVKLAFNLHSQRLEELDARNKAIATQELSARRCRRPFIFRPRCRRRALSL
ncbi:MAG: hypothetical protein AB8B99_14870 [Phormidesmis sp.]